MSHSVQMPALGESVTEGTVTRWLKSEGEQVEVDEPLLEVSTDKVDTEIPSPYGGVLEKILVGEDETADVGADLAIIGDGSGVRRPRIPAAAVTGGSGDLPPDAEGAPEPEPEAAPAAEAAPAEAPSTEAEAPAEKPTAGTGGRPAVRHLGHPAGDGRVGHRGHRHPLAQGGRRRGRASTSRWSRSPPTRSTPRSPPRSPAPCWRSPSARTRPSRSAPQLGVIGDASAAPAAGRRNPKPEPDAEARTAAAAAPRAAPPPRRPAPTPTPRSGTGAEAGRPGDPVARRSRRAPTSPR